VHCLVLRGVILLMRVRFIVILLLNKFKIRRVLFCVSGCSWFESSKTRSLIKFPQASGILT
jgi:hypothetical protein